MRLPLGLTLSSEEKRVLKRVSLFSLIVSATIIVSVWGIRRVLVYRSTREHTQPIEIAARLYEKTSTSLLPIDLETHWWAAEHLLGTGQPHRAVEHLLRIHPVRKGDNEHRVLLARALLESGRYSEARSLLESIHEPGALRDKVRSMLGMSLFYLGEASRAREVLAELVDRNRRSARAACYLGQIHLSSVDADSAEWYLRKATEWDPDYSEPWYQLARLYMNQEHYHKSRTHLLHVLELEPLHARAHSRLGMAYHYLNQFDLARTAYETALALNPYDDNTIYNLGELHLSLYEHLQQHHLPWKENAQVPMHDREIAAQNHFEAALSSFERAATINPTHTQALYKAGLLFLLGKNPGRARSFLSRAAAIEPDNSAVLLQLAVAQEQNGDAAGALATYRQITVHDPMNLLARHKVEYYAKP